MRNVIVDNKWSIDYDDENNDKPLYWRRYNELQGVFDADNATLAMFYALLAAREKEGAI